MEEEDNSSDSDPEVRTFKKDEIRQLEEEGFVTRTVFPVVPPKVEYALTDRGRRAILVVELIRNYGLDLMDEFGVYPVQMQQP